MTIQQAYQILGLEGTESLDTVEKQFAELYNDARTRLVNEFDEKRIAQLKQHIAEVQEALTVLKDLPSATPVTTLPDLSPSHTEFLQILGLPPRAGIKQATKTLKAKQIQLQALLQSSISPEMSRLTKREQERLQKAATLYLPSIQYAKAKQLRLLRLTATAIAGLSLIALGAITGLNYWGKIGKNQIEVTKTEKNTRKTLDTADAKKTKDRKQKSSVKEIRNPESFAKNPDSPSSTSEKRMANTNAAAESLRKGKKTLK